MNRAEEQGAGSKGKGDRRASEPDDTFENLEIWQEAVDPAARVYEVFRRCNEFEFRGQIQAAALSVSSNIAEGYERDSNQELVRFCMIAKASCGEVRSQVHVARRVDLVSEEQAIELLTRSKRLSKRIARYIEIRREKFN